MVRRLNQMSRQCRSKVELIQLGSVHEKYCVWPRPEKTAVIWRRYHWFPHQMTSEERAQKFHTDDASPRSGKWRETSPNVGCFLRLDFPEIIYSQSIKIAKSDLIDIDCIDQSVEIDDTLVSFIDLQYLDFTDSIDLYRKIHLSFCSSKNENWFHAIREFVDHWVASRKIKQFIIPF